LKLNKAEEILRVRPGQIPTRASAAKKTKLPFPHRLSVIYVMSVQQPILNWTAKQLSDCAEMASDLGAAIGSGSSKKGKIAVLPLTAQNDGFTLTDGQWRVR
jgi:hypothetical protein